MVLRVFLVALARHVPEGANNCRSGGSLCIFLPLSYRKNGSMFCSCLYRGYDIFLSDQRVIGTLYLDIGL